MSEGMSDVETWTRTHREAMRMDSVLTDLSGGETPLFVMGWTRHKQAHHPPNHLHRFLCWRLAPKADWTDGQSL